MSEQKALVLFSGGQDSTTCLFWARRRFTKVETVGFLYNQRHVEREIEAQLAITRMLDMPSPHYIPLTTESSALTGEGDLSEMKRGLPASFVPGRNILMLTHAASLAYFFNIHVLVGGMCQTDYSGYPDCRREFIDYMEHALSAGLAYEIQIITPLMYLTKKESVQMAMQMPGCLEALAFSHTCYEGRRPPCGECPACKLRAKGFAEAGVTDPILQMN